MFRLVIELEATDPPLSSKNPTSLKTEIYVTNTDEAHSALSEFMELMRVPESNVDPDGTVWPPQEERHGPLV